MDSRVKNALILLPVSVGVIYAGYLLFSSSREDRTSAEAARQRESIGQFLTADHDVKRQYGDDVVWNDVEKTGAVYNKDSVRTGKASDAVIKLNDGSVIELGENSLVVLDKSTDSLNVNFKAGDISTKNSGLKLKINVKDSQISAPGADLKIKTGLNEKTHVQVARGKASITDKNKKKTDLVQDEAADVDEGQIKNVVKIAVILNSPDDKTQIKSNKDVISQPFTWKVLDPQITTESLEVSPSDQFPPKGLLTFKGHQAVTASLAQGNYFWRVGWRDKSQKQFFTEPRQIAIGSDTRLELVYPENSTQFDVNPDENQVELRWNSQIQPKVYVAEVAITPNFKSLVLNHTVKDTKDVVKDLPSRKYYWRVRAFGDQNQELAVSPVRSFTVAVRTPRLPELQAPDDESNVNAGENVSLRWKGAPKASEYRVLISKDEDQKEVVKSKSIPGTLTSFTWKSPSSGDYYWSVRALNEKGTVIGQSDVWNFVAHRHEKGPAFELISPKDRGEVVRDLGQKPEPVLLQWRTLRPLPGPYTLYMSRDPDFKTSVHQDIINRQTMEVLLRTAGTYYWKLVSAPADGSKEVTSAVNSFTLKGTINLLSPEIIQPADKDSLEIDNPTPVKFSWKPVTEATEYHIVVQRLDPLTHQPITVMDRVTKETAISSTPLPEGNYSWNLTSMDQSGKEGLTGRTYQFSMTAPQLMDAPKLNAPVIK